MDTFVARQPIFDKDNHIYGYELLFRKSKYSQSSGTNDDSATAEVLINSFLNFDLDELTNRTYCFINFTENLLLNGTPENFLPSTLVIEILENIYPSRDIINACKTYKKAGYKIALDDFQLNLQDRNTLNILPFVDIIKVDFRSTAPELRKKIVKLKNFFSIQLLAEKLETEEEYLIALREGFDYFQGYYFQKPSIFTRKEIPSLFHSYMLLIEETKKPEPDIEYLTKIIESDLSLSYKLLNLINNQYKRTYKIESIHQAIMLLGLKEFSRWIYILSIRDIAKQESPITENLIQMSLVRGKFCENVAVKINKKRESSSFFLTGMFSLIDGILQTPMNIVIKKLPLKDEIIEALTGKDNDYRKVLDVIIAIEKTNWSQLGVLSEQLKLDYNVISDIYLQAIKWTNQIISVND